MNVRTTVLACVLAIATTAAADQQSTTNPSDAIVAFVPTDGSAEGAFGFLLDAKGHVATLSRVADAAQRYTVVLASGDEYDARVVATDRRRGVAIVKLAGFGLPFLPLADSASFRGDEAVRLAVAEQGPAWSTHHPSPTFASTKLAGTDRTAGFLALRVAWTAAGPAVPSIGAPVVDAHGAAVGLVASAPQGGTCTVVPANYLAGLYEDALGAGIAGRGSADASPPRTSAATPSTPPIAPAPVQAPAAAARAKADAAPTAPDAQPVAEASEPPPGPAFTIDQVRKVAVYPFTSSGRVDTFWTSLFIEEWRNRRIPQEIIDPYQLAITTPDGHAFSPHERLPGLLADAREAGAQAIVVGEGKKYSAGYRCEIRLIEVNQGKVLWLHAGAASGFLGITTGPSAKSEIVREALRDYPVGRGRRLGGLIACGRS